MSDPNTDEFVIAALGASAGGLEAFEKFFTNMPPDSGLAFIVVQHLAPNHPSALSGILARSSSMTVEEAKDNTQVVPNRVYTIPPNATLTVAHATLHVTTPVEPRGTRTPIDTLFRSLAEDQGHNAVCIMLSGTGIGRYTRSHGDQRVWRNGTGSDIGVCKVRCDSTKRHCHWPRRLRAAD